MRFDSRQFRRYRALKASLQKLPGLVGDLAIVKAWKGDTAGNVVFRKTARNFNAPMATAGKVCVVEVEELVEPGNLDPDGIHLPSIYVDRIFQGQDFEKRIEFRTVTED